MHTPGNGAEARSSTARKPNPAGAADTRPGHRDEKDTISAFTDSDVFYKKHRHGGDSMGADLEAVLLENKGTALKQQNTSDSVKSKTQKK
ncbi:hypothetical protein NDU88_000006 [Pleurodeles waltl]|uniref:Uncharacterized protein n=1 Tax=Pleurodeles waltl TaxID=8319 RepID=A0AAV7V3W7_PLEWA|nr:hypothetical protein NDU88_000006 [Pleurodeles waltl]